MPPNENPPPASMKRLPLTPIPIDGPFPADDNAKFTSTTSYDDFRSHSDDELRPSLYQRRKSSVPALTLVKVPNNRRRSQNRRMSPVRNSPGIPASLTPIPPTSNSERRTSLPALHFHETVQNVIPLRIETGTSSRRSSISEDIYGGLQSFTFGAPPNQPHHNSDDSDEDERIRRDRAKIRAIDDGTRRPSLPTNDLTPSVPRPRHSVSSTTSSATPSLASSAHIVVGERQWDEHGEPDWDFVMGETTPTVGSPPPTTPGSVFTAESVSAPSERRRPSDSIPLPVLRRRSRSADELACDLDRMHGMTPTQLSTSTPLFSWAEGHSFEETRTRSSSPEENALDGFDLNFILSQPDTTETNHRLQRQISTNRLRSKFRSKVSNTVAASSRIEDTFTGHLGQYDPIYERRKREWSFRREIRPGHPVTSQQVNDKDGTALTYDDQEKWRCEWVGIFTVHKFQKASKGATLAQHPDSPRPTYNRLHIQHTPDPSNKGNKEGGPRMIVHRHSRARAFSIFRSPSQKAESSGGGVLMGAKDVLREYTRTESTRTLRTYGLIDEEDSRPSHHGHKHREPRLNTLSHESNHQHSQSGHERLGSSWMGANTVADFEVAITSESIRAPAPGPAFGPSNFAQSSGSSLPIQLSEAHIHRDSNRTVLSPLPATSRSISTSPPPSLKISQTQMAGEPSTPVGHQGISPAALPRVSTSHAEAFAMRDLDSRDLDTRHHHHHAHASPPHTVPSTPSPHGQAKGFGFGVRFKRAFISSRQPQMKEPVSPGTEDEDEPKTANQDGKFAPPWMTVARRAEKEQHERMIRVLNNSFESVGLIPPHDKKKSSKARNKSKSEECAVFEDVPDDSMCMLLPLWPGEVLRPGSVSRRSSRSDRSRGINHHPEAASQTSATYLIPLEERKYLLVYYTPFVESQLGDGSNSSSNNKKRRRPQTAGDNPHQHSHHQHNGAHVGGSNSFAVVARLVGYSDLRSSNIRLPTKGLSVTGSLEAANIAIPSISGPGLNSQVIAQCHGPENGIELVQEGLERLGLKDPAAPRDVDVNGDPIPVKLSEIGRAIVEMVFCGCLSLMSFPT